MTVVSPPVSFIVASVAAAFFSATTLPNTSQNPLVGGFLVSLPNQTVLRIHAATIFHTIDSDFFSEDDGTEYVQTGDIPAMWLRDSTLQTMPYVRLANAVTDFQPIVRQVIERNARNVLTDPHANAFTAGYRVWEEKWEPDSLADPTMLVYLYWLQTHDRSVFTDHLRWSMEHILGTYACEQHHAACSGYRSRYLINGGQGAAFSDTGMIWGAFRPSDDPDRYPFNVPQNMLAAVSLSQMATLAARGFGDAHMALRAAELAVQIREGIERFGKVYDFRYGWVYAYEVDGRGDFALMDDANPPNLVSASIIGYVSPDDQVYQDTRRFSLSTDDPYYYRGSAASGLGSSHTPTGWVWPLGLTAQAFTSTDPTDVANLIDTISATSGSEELMHESFDPNDPTRFTRPEFGWANAAFAELIFRSVAGYPGYQYADPVFPPLLPLGAQTPVLTSLYDQLVIRGNIQGALQFSCTNALPYCYIR